MSRRVRLVLGVCAFAALGPGVGVGSSACLPSVEEVPLDEPVSPTGLALAGDRLLVVSSNFDGAFPDGALLVADLPQVREESKTGDGSVEVLGAYEHAAVMPSFGDNPAVTSGGERAYVPTRESHVVVALDIAADGALSCGATDVRDRCQAPFVLQLQDSDPAHIVILGEQREGDALVRTDALVTMLSSPRVIFFSDDRRRDGAAQLRIDGALDLGESITGVRSAVLRPAVGGSDPVIIATADLNPQSGANGAVLAVFRPRSDSRVEFFDVTQLTGALSLRDVALVPGEDGDDDALVVTLRGLAREGVDLEGPDGLARFEIDDDGDLPSLRLSTIASSCRQPTALAPARLPVGGDPAVTVDRVLVTCQTSEAVEAIDPLTLQPTDAVRFAGRGPFDVVVNSAVEPQEAYVSFHFDNSIGVFHLTDDDGAPRLVFRGRIGEQAPAPETGRE